MKYNCALRGMLFIIILTGCRQNTSTDDPEKLKMVLLNFFDGIKDKDFKKIRSATTDDFILYEDGAVWNIDSAFMNINRHLPFTVEYTLNNYKINVDQKSGDMTYFNHGDFVFKDGRHSIDWIESATFRKNREGQWKMNFLHVTVRD